MIKERIFTSLLGIALLILVLWLGSPWFTLLVGLSAIIAAWEFHNLIHPNKNKTVLRLGIALSFLVATGPAFKNKSLFIVILAALVLPFLWINIRGNFRHNLLLHEKWVFFFSIFFMGFLLSYYTSLIDINQGRSWTILALFTTFAADSGAFFIGRTWGKKPLTLKISPHKTWEGAIGGLLCAILAGLLLSSFFGLTNSILLSAIPGLLIGILSPMGDLGVSLYKRRAGVKDSGKLLPGHGGLLDRIDSLLISGIVIYYYAKVLQSLV